MVRPAEVELHIYDIAGQRVRQLREGVRGAGSYRTRWEGRDDDGRSVSSGVYLYRITATGAAPGPAGLPHRARCCCSDRGSEGDQPLAHRAG